MPGLIVKIRNGKRALPAIALATAALLLTGEWFSCCRINEAFAQEITRFARALGMTGNATPLPVVAVAVSLDADAHPHCHGHAASSAHMDGVAATASEPGVHPGSPAYEQDFHCLSENAITRQSMVGSESRILPSAPPAIMGYELPTPMHFAFVERPRPQSRSSPPVYLLTLRLLV